MKKSNFILGFGIILSLLLIAGGTLAWFTSTTDPVVNSFTAGTLNIELVDKFDASKAQNVNPGDCFEKDVYVINTGTKRAGIRIKADMAFEDDLDISIVNYSLNYKWELRDGYYYYKEILPPNSRTQSLFENSQICFNGPNMGNHYQGKKFTIEVLAEAIQVTNGAPNQAGWSIIPVEEYIQVIPAESPIQ